MKKRAVKRWLLLIPLALILAIALITAGLIAEANQAAQTLAENPDIHGHASGYSFFLTAPVGLLLFVIVTIFAVVKAVKGARYNRRLEQTMGDPESFAADRREYDYREADRRESARKPYDPEL